MNTLNKINHSLLIAGFLTMAAATPLAAAVPALTAVPNTFTAGGSIVADEMNENFSTLVDNITNISLTPGPQGDTGLQGETGPQGIQGGTGLQGIQGNQGEPGATGPQGVPGNQGNQGNQGFKGDPGVPGADGAPGIDGLPGADGTSCSAIQNTGSATISCDDGSMASVYDGADGASGGGVLPGFTVYYAYIYGTGVGTDGIYSGSPSTPGVTVGVVPTNTAYTWIAIDGRPDQGAGSCHHQVSGTYPQHFTISFGNTDYNADGFNDIIVGRPNVPANPGFWWMAICPPLAP